MVVVVGERGGGGREGGRGRRGEEGGGGELACDRDDFIIWRELGPCQVTKPQHGTFLYLFFCTKHTLSPPE